MHNSLNMNQISEIMNQSQKSNFNIMQDKNEEYGNFLKNPNDNQIQKDMKIQEGSYEELSKLLEKQDLAKQIKDQLILINQNKFRLPQMNYLEKIMSNDP